jgi:hypothetical protein
MSTHDATASDVFVLVAATVGLYVWIMATLLEMFGAWIAAAGPALLRYIGYL